MTSIGVIIPVFNRETEIVRALESIARQKSLPDEVIVVDDGSKDASAASAQQFMGRIPGLKVLQVENGGAGLARNIGINASSSEWLSFLDSDDEWAPEKIQILRQVSATRPETDVVVNACIHVDEASGRVIHKRHAPPQQAGRSIYFSEFRIKTSGFSVKRELLSRTGMMFAERRRVCEDYHLFWPAIALATDVLYLPDGLTIIHAATGTLSRDGQHERHARDNMMTMAEVIRWSHLARADAVVRDPLSGFLYRTLQDLLVARLRKKAFGELVTDLRIAAPALGAARTLRAVISVLAARK